MGERILIVEQDPQLAEALAYSIEQEGFGTVTAGAWDTALELSTAMFPDLMILDVDSLHTDLVEVLQPLRERLSSLPVIILIGESGEQDRATGLELGADDCLTKPFAMRELVARARAVLRRSARGGGRGDDAEPERSVELNVRERECVVRGRPVNLSPKELALLAYLMRHAGRVRTRDEIMREVWGTTDGVHPRTVDVHVRWLRTKLEDDPAHPQYVRTVRCVGYKFVAPETQ